MEYNYEDIEQYVKGQLTGEALAKFETELRTNEALAEEVALYKNTDLVLAEKFQYEKEDAELAQTFGQLGQKYFHKKEAVTTEVLPATPEIPQDKTKVVPIRKTQPSDTEITSPGILRWLKPAAGLAIAAAIVLLIFQPWQKNLLDTYYQPYALQLTERSSDEKDLMQAQKDYLAKKYTSALSIFEKHPDNIEVQLARGNCEFNLGDTDAALKTFQTIALKNSIYTPTANWYLALTYLKQNQPEKAKLILQNIPKGTYYQKAQDLLRQL